MRSVALASVSLALVLAAGIVSGASGAAPDRSDRKGLPAVQNLRAVKALQSLEPRALRRWPGGFAGLWLGKKGKVLIAFTRKAEARVEKLAARFPAPERLRAVKVDDSLAALRAIQGRMISDRESDPVVPARKYDLDISVKKNTLLAIVDRPVNAQLAGDFATRYGPDVLVKQGPIAEPHALFVCNSRLDCPPNLRSGIVTHAETNTNCTTAFNVTYPGVNNTTRRGVLSAAHCGNPDADYLDDRDHNGSVYGTVVAEQQSGAVDAELHSVVGQITPDTVWSATAPWIYVSDATKRGEVTKVSTYAGLTIGAPACKAGITTGKSCGEVLTKYYSPSYVPTSHDFVKADYCSDKGDSGAGVYSRTFPNFLKHLLGQKSGPSILGGYRALGIHSGGAKDTPCSDPQHYSLFGQIEFAQQAFGATVIKK